MMQENISVRLLLDCISSILVVKDPRCLLSIWSEWSSCINATCERSGVQIRTRMYADKKAAMALHCAERLEEQQPCNIDCFSSQTKNQNAMMGMIIFHNNDYQNRKLFY